MNTNNAQPDVFIQDRVKTNAMPDSEGASRYVLSKVYPNGDVENMAYSDDRNELQEIKESETS